MKVISKYFFGFNSKEIGIKIGKEVSGSNPDILLLFHTEQYSPEEITAGIYETLSEKVIIAGGVGGGVINTHNVARFGVSFSAICFEDSNCFVKPELYSEKELDFGKGSESGESFEKRADLKLLLSFYSGDSEEVFSDFTRGQASSVSVPVSGGSLAYSGTMPENLKPNRTLFLNGRLVCNAVLSLGFYGDIQVKTAISSGWETPYEKPCLITDTEDCVVKKIGEKTAVSFYEDFFGSSGSQKDFFLFPLSIKSGSYSKSVLFPQKWNSNTGEIKFSVSPGKNVPVSIAVASPEQLIENARASFQEVVNSSTKPGFSLMFSSHIRYQILGTLYREEKRALFSQNKNLFSLLGVTTKGEIFYEKDTDSSETIYHNGTTVCIVCGEKSDEI